MEWDEAHANLHAPYNGGLCYAIQLHLCVNLFALLEALTLLLTY